MAVLSGRSGVVSGATSFPQSYSAPQPQPPASRIVTAPPAISDAVSAISGLSARWRADQVAGLANGDPVTSWPDTSGNGYAATQSSPGNRPTWQSGVINGHPVLRFVAASNQALTASAPAGLDAQTVFAVVKMASTTGERTIRAGGADSALQFRVTTGGALNLVKQSIANIGSSSGTVGTTAFQSVAATFDQTADTYAFYIDGAASGGGTTTQSLSADTTVIGTHPFAPTEAFDGDIAELIVWDRVLTSTELASVQSYVTSRYFSTTASGSGMGSWSFSGAGSGTRTPKASGTGAWSFTGTGAGTSTHRGTGTGSWTVTGAGTGTTSRRGTGTGSFAFAGSGTGERVAKASGTGSWSFVGTGTGATVRRGTGSGTATWTGSGSGVAPLVGVNDGSGSGSWAFVGTGAGVTPPEPGAARDITLSIGPGRSRTLTATGTSRGLTAVGRSRSLTIRPRE